MIALWVEFISLYIKNNGPNKIISGNSNYNNDYRCNWIDSLAYRNNRLSNPNNSCICRHSCNSVL